MLLYGVYMLKEAFECKHRWSHYLKSINICVCIYSLYKGTNYQQTFSNICRVWVQFAFKIIEIKCIADLPQVDESVPLILDPLVPKVKNCVHVGVNNRPISFSLRICMYVLPDMYLRKDEELPLRQLLLIQSSCCVQIRFCWKRNLPFNPVVVCKFVFVRSEISRLLFQSVHTILRCCV